MSLQHVFFCVACAECGPATFTTTGLSSSKPLAQLMPGESKHPKTIPHIPGEVSMCKLWDRKFFRLQ